MIVSSASSVKFEDIAKEAPDAEKWMQMFLHENDSINEDFVRQAERLRFGAIVVTIDMSVTPLRYFNERNRWKDIHEMQNYARYVDDNGNPIQFKFYHGTWDQLQKLINSTSLPVIVKGVLTLEDTALSYLLGAKGIIASNHGGRQIDGTISTVSFRRYHHLVLDYLPNSTFVRRSVTKIISFCLALQIEALSDIVSDFRSQFPDSKDEFEIYLDGGIRSGIDVFRALAIGAKFVFVGRAALYGLFHSVSIR